VDFLEHLASMKTADFIPSGESIHLDTPDKVDVKDSILEGSLVKKPMPEYPVSAKRNRLEGKVVIQVEIGEDGYVHEMTILSAPDPSLAIAAMLAVHQFQYKPYY
jgi:TonB family protein